MANLRNAQLEDVETLTDIFIKARKDMSYLSVLYTHEETLWWMENIVFKENQLRVAENDGKVVGFLAKNLMTIEHLYLAPEAQNFGIGQKLLNECQETENKLELWVFQENKRAILFYERSGFKLAEKTNGERNEEKVPDARYIWEK